MIASFSVILAQKLVKDCEKVHMFSIASQAIIFLLIAATPVFLIVLILHSLREFLSILADASLDTIIFRNGDGLIISRFLIIWELSTGLGKVIGSYLASHNVSLPLILASVMLFVYLLNIQKDLSQKLSQSRTPQLSRSLRFQICQDQVKAVLCSPKLFGIVLRTNADPLLVQKPVNI